MNGVFSIIIYVHIYVISTNVYIHVFWCMSVILCYFKFCMPVILWYFILICMSVIYLLFSIISVFLACALNIIMCMICDISTVDFIYPMLCRNTSFSKLVTCSTYSTQNKVSCFLKDSNPYSVRKPAYKSSQFSIVMNELNVHLMPVKLYISIWSINKLEHSIGSAVTALLWYKHLYCFAVWSM